MFDLGKAPRDEKLNKKNRFYDYFETIKRSQFNNIFRLINPRL